MEPENSEQIQENQEPRAADPGPGLNRGKTIVFSVATALLVIAICLGILEIGLRATMPKQEAIARSIPYDDLVDYHTYEILQDIHFTNEAGDHITFRSDENGLRNPQGQLPGADIILLGDSFISALNTPENKTLAHLLRARGYKIYNAGMDGFSTFQARYLLEDLLLNAHPRTVLLFFYLGNDLRDNFAAAVYQGPNRAPIREKREAEKDKKPRSEILCRKSVLCYRLFYSPVTILGKPRKTEKEPREDAPEPDNAMPENPMANFCLSEILSLRNNYDQDMGAAVMKTNMAFSQLSAMARAYNFRLVVIGLPSKAMIYEDMAKIPYSNVEKRFDEFVRESEEQGFSYDRPDEVVGALARGNGLEYISLLPLFRKNRNRNIFYKDDPHWTALGQKITADFIVKKILK